jgi:DNA-binding NarL/FixJ family response regulator
MTRAMPRGAMSPKDALCPGDWQIPDSRAARQEQIVVIDGRPLMAESVACWLRRARPDCEVSIFADTDVLLRDAKPIDVSFVLIYARADWRGRRSVCEAVELLSNVFREAPIAVLADEEDAGVAVEVLRCGARAYVPTSLDPAVVSGVLDFVVAGGTFLPATLLINDRVARAWRSRLPEAASAPAGSHQPAGTQDARTPDAHTRTVADESQLSKLTPREAQVLACLSQGNPNKLIAYELGMRENTVKVHIHRLMKKLRASNRTEAALLADRALMPQPAAKQ